GTDRSRYAAAVRLHPSLADQRSRDVGRPLHHASRARIRRPALQARHAARHGVRRRSHLRADGPGGRCRMTPAAFAKLALALEGATQGSHGGHPDFRAGGRVFATIGYPDMTWAMVKLTPDQQRLLCDAEPAMFQPVKGGWGQR